MARRCTTVPGFGTCCAVAQKGQLGQAVPIRMSNGKVRCGECNVIQRAGGRGPGFRFRFRKNSECGIGPGGCPALAGGGGGQTLALPGF